MTTRPKSKKSDHASRVRRVPKQNYVPPRISFVEIETEEALMGICKGGTSSGPYGGGCPGNCKSSAS